MPQQKTGAGDNSSQRGSSSPRRCKALTTSGDRCKRPALAGLTVCKSHGGGTAASVRASKLASASQQATRLWGLSADTSSVNVVEELNRLARHKITDITAIRLKLGDEAHKHIGLLTDSHDITEYDIEGTVQSKTGTQERRARKSGTSPWVQELHKAEQELVTILRTLQEVTGGTEQVDTDRLRMQTAREAARILKAYPGISVDDVAMEVVKRA